MEEDGILIYALFGEYHTQSSHREGGIGASMIIPERLAIDSDGLPNIEFWKMAQHAMCTALGVEPREMCWWVQTQTY